MIKSVKNASSISQIDLSDANVFFQDNYAKMQNKEGRVFVYAFSDAFIIPVVISKKLIFRFASFESEPYYYNKSVSEDEAGFISSVCDYIKREYRVQWFSMNSPASLFLTCPPKTKKIPFGSHVIDLSKDTDELWKNIHTKHRNVIKKAEKDGVEIVSGRTDKLIEDYHMIDVETWERSDKKATDKDGIKSQIELLGENAIIYIAYLNGQPQSGALFYFNKAMCYYMFGANCNKPHTGAGNLLQWRAINDMKNDGVLKYSFVGCRFNEDENSKYHGIQRFKERFGGELVKGYLFKIIYNSFLYHLFKVCICLRNLKNEGNLSYPRDVIDQEIHKWKNIQ